MSSIQELEIIHEQQLKDLELKKQEEKIKFTGNNKELKKIDNKYKKLKEELVATQQNELWEFQINNSSDNLQEDKEDKSDTKEEDLNNILNHQNNQNKQQQDKKKKKNAKTKQKRLDKQNKLRDEAQKEFKESGGITEREYEIEKIKKNLKENQIIFDIESDGHCLYRSLAHQLNLYLDKNNNLLNLLQKANQLVKNSKNNNLINDKLFNYQHIRCLIANQLRNHSDNYFPFIMDVCSSMDDYANIVENSSEWGGQVEIQAFIDLCEGNVKLNVVQDGSTVVMENVEKKVLSNDDMVVVLTISYHRRYYALGEHYNSVVTITVSEDKQEDKNVI
ncbi:hypothetical protein ABK040_002110 [Willaertia magna]